MATLTIKNFCCIEDARITTGKLTIIIGPQASGKSIITKLLYFFNSIVEKHQSYALELNSIKDFHNIVIKDFKETFPPPAWGNKAFEIFFSIGSFEFKFHRSAARGKKLNENIRFSACDNFLKYYSESEAELEKVKEKIEKSKGDDFYLANSMAWTMQNRLRKKIYSVLGSEYFSSQTFIPAGRSFFTSIGRAISAFEHGGLLDPFTIRFGKLVFRARERLKVGVSSLLSTKNPVVQELLQGSIVTGRDGEFLHLDDGRRIPFQTLSSGQQELLPLILALEFKNWTLDLESIIYIEEPEAHLFPDTQSAVANYIIRTAASNKWKSHLVITTHSPYFLAKINNYIKAFRVSRKRGKIDLVSKVIPRELWLNPAHISAYAIDNGKVLSIIGEDGLIDSAYLDSISSSMQGEFLNLVEIEYMKAVKGHAKEKNL